MSPAVYTHRVQYYETDKMGFTHHSNYIRWMEEARAAFLADIGWDYAKLEENGIISPVTSVECHYRTPSTFPDVITVVIIVEACRGARMRIGYRMTNQDGKLVCDGASEHCFLNTEGKLLRLSRDCPAFYATLCSYIAPAAEK